MKRFSYIQFLKGCSQENIDIRQELIKQFQQNGFLILYDVDNSEQIINNMNDGISSIERTYGDNDYVGLGYQIYNKSNPQRCNNLDGQYDNVLIYSNNTFPLQNIEFIKKILDINDKNKQNNYPELLQRKEYSNNKLTECEIEFHLFSRNIFSKLLQMIDLEQKSNSWLFKSQGDQTQNNSNNNNISQSEDKINNNLKNENENQKKDIILQEIFDKSEIQKIQSIRHYGMNSYQRRYTPLDFGLGSLLMYSQKYQYYDKNEQLVDDIKTEGDQIKKNVDETEINESGIYVMNEQNEIKLNAKVGDIIISCGDYLNYLTNGYIHKPNYIKFINHHNTNEIQKQSRFFFHQSYFYPHLTFNPNQTNSKNNQLNNNKSNPIQKQDLQNFKQQQLNKVDIKDVISNVNEINDEKAKEQQINSQENQTNQNTKNNNKQILKKMNMMSQSLAAMSATGGQRYKQQIGEWVEQYIQKSIDQQSQDYINSLQIDNDLRQSIRITQKQFNNPHNPINVIHFNKIDSTMNIAQDWIKGYVKDEMSYCFIADQQFSGYGQNNNKWLSPLGNCYVTFLIKYDMMLLYCLSQLSAISVVETLDKYINKNVQLKNKPVLKWINDIFMNEKKISGVLCKMDGEYAIIGIGVNLNHTPTDVLQNCTSLKDELKLINTGNAKNADSAGISKNADNVGNTENDDEINIIEFIERLWNKLSNNLNEVREWNTFNAILGKVEGRMRYLNEPVAIYDITLTEILHKGIFKGLNDYGHAILQDFDDPNKIETIYSGRMRPYQKQQQ